MGSIAARDCIRIVELTEQVAAALLLAVVQAVELRDTPVSGDMRDTFKQLRQHVSKLTTDRAMEQELRLCVSLIRQQHWRLYE